MKRTAVVLALLALLAAVTWAALTPDEAALLDRALALYRDMHAGAYTVKVVSASISNGRHVLRTEIKTASGLTFPGRLELPVQATTQKTAYNGLFLFGGTLFGINYSRRIVGPFSLQCGAGWGHDAIQMWGGVGFMW
jgi:hypothetical protein